MFVLHIQTLLCTNDAVLRDMVWTPQVEQAVVLLRAALKRDPQNVRLKLELADAINTVIRIKTNANSLVIEGTQDCPAFKKIWGTLGREVFYRLASIPVPNVNSTLDSFGVASVMWLGSRAVSSARHRGTQSDA